MGNDHKELLILYHVGDDHKGVTRLVKFYDNGSSFAKKTKSIIKNKCERSKNFIQTQSLSNLRRKVGYTFSFLINF